MQSHQAELAGTSHTHPLPLEFGGYDGIIVQGKLGSRSFDDSANLYILSSECQRLFQRIVFAEQAIGKLFCQDNTIRWKIVCRSDAGLPWKELEEGGIGSDGTYSEMVFVFSYFAHRQYRNLCI